VILHSSIPVFGLNAMNHNAGALSDNLRAKKILLIGTLGAGKTTPALDLAKKIGYPYLSIA